MAAFPREEMEEMMRRWLKANEDAEEAGDWKPMAEFYTKDAEYTWNLAPSFNDAAFVFDPPAGAGKVVLAKAPAATAGK